MNYSSSKGESFRLINYSRWVDEALLYFTDNFPSGIIATKSTLIDLSIHQVFLALPPVSQPQETCFVEIKPYFPFTNKCGTEIEAI